MPEPKKPPPKPAATEPPRVGARSPAVTRPRMAAPALIAPELLASVEVLSSQLDCFDYFQLFGLTPTAGPKEIKEAYYRESRLYHPDRFCPLPDKSLKTKINSIFKRVTEAYVVLRDDQKRTKYIVDVTGPDRDKKLRYTEASQTEQKAEAKKAQEEQVGTTPKGRECFKNGVKELEARRFDAAARQLKMALMYEPANAKYKDKLKEVDTQWDKVRPKNDFRIK